MATTTAIIASSTVASTTQPIQEVSPWVSYSIDIVLLLLFLFILFFTKPEKHSEVEELSPAEQPNELEKILKTDSEEEK